MHMVAFAIGFDDLCAEVFGHAFKVFCESFNRITIEDFFFGILSRRLNARARQKRSVYLVLSLVYHSSINDIFSQEDRQ